jgi:membrane protease subunit HflK
MMDAHTHSTGRPPRGPDVPATAGTGEQALAGALRTVFGALRVVMVIALIGLVFSNTRLLRQNQRAVILRFGKIVGTGASRVRGPGLVFAWPQPIDQIIVVDAGRVQAIEVDDFMYRRGAREGGTEQLGETLDPALDGYTVTGDFNIMHTIWRIEYQIDDVVKYVLNGADADTLLRSSVAVVHTSAEFTIDNALWGEGLALRTRVQKHLQDRLDQASSGIRLVAVRTPTRREPVQTTEAFLRSQQAGLESSKMLQEAQRYQTQVLAAAAGDAAPRLLALIRALAAAEEAPEGERDEARIERLRARLVQEMENAAGDVTRILGDARTYRWRVAKAAESMAATFEELDRKYRENPEIFIRELYQSAIQDVLAKAGYAFIIPPGQEPQVWLKLEPPRKKQRPTEAATEVTRTEAEQMRTRNLGP